MLSLSWSDAHLLIFSRELRQGNARRRAAAEHKTHKRLRIVGGKLAGKRLVSGRGETTRPMMEKVSAIKTHLAKSSSCVPLLTDLSDETLQP